MGFWTGGFVQSAAMFMSGVLTAGVILGAATKDMGNAQRSRGRCEIACRDRGFSISTVEQDETCRCARVGKPDQKTTIDPRETPEDCRRGWNR